MRKTHGILNHTGIQNRTPGFQRVFHGCPVYLTQNILRQIGIHVKQHSPLLPVLLSVDGFKVVGAGKDPLSRLSRHHTLRCLPIVFSDQLGLCLFIPVFRNHLHLKGIMIRYVK